MAKKPDVLGELDAIAPKRKTWLEHMPEESQAKLLEIKALVKAGKCNHSMRTIHSWVKDNGGAVAATNLSDWLYDKA